MIANVLRAFAAAGALVLVASSAGAGDGAARASPHEGELPVVVSEAPGIVRLTIVRAEDVRPDSVEIQIDGRTMELVARDVRGRRLRSRPLRPLQEAVEDGAEASYDADGSLTITLAARSPQAP